MKRREFIVSAAGALGATAFDRALAGALPNPPANLIVDGGSQLNIAYKASDAPPWVNTAVSKGWAVGDWLAISGSAPTPGYGFTATNSVEDVATQPIPGGFEDAFIHAWNGAALCPGHRAYGVYMMGPGGAHNEYDRGDMFMFDLETRAWEQVAPPDTSGYDPSTTFGEYNDGAPVGNHSAWWPFYDSNRNEFCLPRGWGDPMSGSDQYPKPYGHGFGLSGYDRSGYAPSMWRRYPQLSGLTPSQLNDGLSQQCGGAWDEARKSYWLLSANNSFSSSGIVARYDSSANTWTTYTPQWCIFLGSAYAIDPVRDVLVMLTMNSDPIRCLDLKNPSERYQSPTSTSALWTAQETGGSKPSNYIECGWEWSDAHQGFIYYCWDSPSRVKLAQYAGGGSFAAGSQTDYALNWSDISVGNNGITPPGQVSAGSYSKFRLAKWIGIEIAFFCPRTSGAMYAFRVT